jgi:hypothetical protein
MVKWKMRKVNLCFVLGIWAGDPMGEAYATAHLAGANRGGRPILSSLPPRFVLDPQLAVEGGGGVAGSRSNFSS